MAKQLQLQLSPELVAIESQAKAGLRARNRR
jgi:hypothetical protein